MSDELDSFVKDSLSQGLERSAIRDVLLQGGWREDGFTNALSAYADIAPGAGTETQALPASQGSVPIPALLHNALRHRLQSDYPHLRIHRQSVTRSSFMQRSFSGLVYLRVYENDPGIDNHHFPGLPLPDVAANQGFGSLSGTPPVHAAQVAHLPHTGHCLQYHYRRLDNHVSEAPGWGLNDTFHP